MLRGSVPHELQVAVFGSDGDGYGSGSGYWRLLAARSVEGWSHGQRQRYAEACKAAAAIAFWRSDKDGRPANGGDGEAARPGLVQEIAGPLRLCGSGALHATLKPEKWKGERLWIVALYGEVLRDDSKMGALKREVLGEVDNALHTVDVFKQKLKTVRGAK